MTFPKRFFIRGIAILPALVLVAVLGSILIGVDGLKSMSRYGQTADMAAGYGSSGGDPFTASAVNKMPILVQNETQGGTPANPVLCEQKADPKLPANTDGAAGIGMKCVQGCKYTVTAPQKVGEDAKVKVES